MTNNYKQKNKEKLQKEARQKSKTKRVNMLVVDIEVLLKKKNKISVNMVVNDIRIL